jgi:L-asparaginase
MRKRVLILHTGGTLGMRPREPGTALEPDELGTTLHERAPEMDQVADVSIRYLFNTDSSDMTPDHWMTLAAEIAGAVGGHDGVVVTHGTDTMAYTAAALSYVLRNLPFPVVLTGSQRPLVDVRSDARANLVGAVDLATRDIPEVAIYFGGHLLRGNRAIKSSTFDFGAFSCPNFPPLAKLGAGFRLVTEPLRPAGEFKVEGKFDPRVAVIWWAPGQPVTPLEALMGTDTKGVLLEAFGMGNIPVADEATCNALGTLVDRGIVVAIGSQSPHGRVDLDLYPGGRKARDAGVVGTGDMTAEAGSVKLMYLLGTCTTPEEVRGRLTEPIAGEISTD